MQRSRESLMHEIDAVMSTPEIARDPNRLHTTLFNARKKLYALFDAEDFEWEDEYYEMRADWKALKERIDARLSSLDEQRNALIPKARPKPRVRSVLRVKKNVCFRSVRSFLRDFEDVRTQLWNRRKEFSEKLIKEHVATFIGIFLSVSEEELIRLPGSEEERDRALNLYRFWSDWVKQVAAGDGDDWVTFGRQIAQSLEVKS